ncbi:lectin-like protein, partial [Dolichospermum circinale CS-1225]|uniref:lectin-like protein n=1 Tax=Dolichospermum circinale TaxID=109265 RepID=UPI00232EF01F
MTRFTVTNNNDSGAGSLRQAIIDAGNVVGVDIIDLTSVSGTINLNSSLGNLNTGNDINFVDDGNTTISGQNAYQIIGVNGASVTFSRLTFVNGLARGGDGNGGGGGGLGAGGALFIYAGNVTLNNVTFSGNRAFGGNANGNAGSGGNTASNGSGGGSGGGLNSTTNGGSGGGAGIYDYDTGRPGGNGGSGNFGAGGGGGGGGYDYDFYSSNDHGNGGAGGAGGQFGGNGNGGAGGDNRSGSRGGGGAGLGGAIFVNSGASLTLLNSVFTSNSATGGQGANNGQGVGANIFVRDGATAQTIGANYSDNYDGTINAVSFPTNAYEYNGSIYRLTTAGTWQQAQLQAQSLGGNLVTVNNQAEQDWLVTTFGPTERLWIGLTDEETAGQYKWASGETSTYRNWATNEPSDSAGHVQDYVYINYLSPGRWDDLGTGQLRGIIENKFYEYNGSKYLLTGPGTWKQAQDQARSLGGNLVTVNNQAEQDWLVTTFGPTERLWIGLTDEETEGQFKWVSGETSAYTNNWSVGQPDNFNNNEDYVELATGVAGKWNDLPSTVSFRGIIEINQYGATGRNTDSQFFVLAKPEKFTVSVLGGFGPDIFQLRSYDGLTTSQQVTGSGGSDVFNISLEGSSGTVGLNFNTGKLKQLAELLVTPDWDVREKRRAADINTALIGAGIDYVAAAAGIFANLDPTGIAGGVVDAAAATAHLANDVANIEKNYNLDIEEYQNNLAGIGNFFDGQGANGWGTVNVTLKRSIVEIMDFQPGIDTITLPKLTGNQAYRYTLVSGINGTGVEVAYNNQTNEPSTFLRIYIDPTLLPTVQGQNVGVTQFIESLFTNNATNGVIGTTRNNTSKVAVTGSSYTGTIAGDYIYVAQNNPTVGSVKIYGNAGDDLLAGRKNGSNEIYGGDGDDFIVPGGVNDTIDGGAGYDQVNYSQNAVGISITSSNSTNFKTVESVTGTVYNDTINFSDLQVAPDDGLPINLEGRAGNDSLVGSQYQDVIDGEDGNDTLIGGAGSDILKGGAGDDILNPGYSQGSTDTVDGGNGNDLLQVDYSNKTSASVGIHLGFQNNNVIYHRAGTNGDNYELVKFSDIERFDIIGTQYDDVFEGRSGNDTFNGGAGNDILNGGAGNDILNGGAGNDTLNGGLGDDIYIVDSATDTVTENVGEGTDIIQSSVTYTIAANVENLTLTGTAASNGTGNELNNVITGNSANNILDGGAGIDTLIGGLGDDIYVVDSTTDIITENANEGTDTIQSSVTYTIATLTNAENLTLTGTTAINGTGNAGNNVITGNGANNILDGGAGTDTLIGGLGNDIYVVDSTTDTITENASGGTDTIQSSVTYTIATLTN